MESNNNSENIHRERLQNTPGSSSQNTENSGIFPHDRSRPFLRFPDIQVFETISTFFRPREVSPLPPIYAEYDFLKGKEVEIQDKVNVLHACQPYSSFSDVPLLLHLCEKTLEVINDYTRTIGHGIQEKENEMISLGADKQKSEEELMRYTLVLKEIKRKLGAKEQEMRYLSTEPEVGPTISLQSSLEIKGEHENILLLGEHQTSLVTTLQKLEIAVSELNQQITNNELKRNYLRRKAQSHELLLREVENSHAQLRSGMPRSGETSAYHYEGKSREALKEDVESLTNELSPITREIEELKTESLRLQETRKRHEKALEKANAAQNELETIQGNASPDLAPLREQIQLFKKYGYKEIYHQFEEEIQKWNEINVSKRPGEGFIDKVRKHVDKYFPSLKKFQEDFVHEAKVKVATLLQGCGRGTWAGGKSVEDYFAQEFSILISDPTEWCQAKRQFKRIKEAGKHLETPAVAFNERYHQLEQLGHFEILYQLSYINVLEIYKSIIDDVLQSVETASIVQENERKSWLIDKWKGFTDNITKWARENSLALQSINLGNEGGFALNAHTRWDNPSILKMPGISDMNDIYKSMLSPKKENLPQYQKNVVELQQYIANSIKAMYENLPESYTTLSDDAKKKVLDEAYAQIEELIVWFANRFKDAYKAIMISHGMLDFYDNWRSIYNDKILNSMQFLQEEEERQLNLLDMTIKEMKNTIASKQLEKDQIAAQIKNTELTLKILLALGSEAKPEGTAIPEAPPTNPESLENSQKIDFRKITVQTESGLLIKEAKRAQSRRLTRRAGELFLDKKRVKSYLLGTLQKDAREFLLFIVKPKRNPYRKNQAGFGGGALGIPGGNGAGDDAQINADAAFNAAKRKFSQEVRTFSLKEGTCSFLVKREDACNWLFCYRSEVEPKEEAASPQSSEEAFRGSEGDFLLDIGDFLERFLKGEFQDENQREKKKQWCTFSSKGIFILKDEKMLKKALKRGLQRYAYAKGAIENEPPKTDLHWTNGDVGQPQLKDFCKNSDTIDIVANLLIQRIKEKYADKEKA